MIRFLLVLIALCSFKSQAQIPSDSLLLYYPFNGNANDIGGNTYDGVVSGATSVDDRFGNPNSAYFFDGSNDYVSLPNVSALKPEFPISFSFWVKLKSLSQVKNYFFSTNPANDYAGCTFNTTSSGTGGLNINYGANSGGSNSLHRRTKTSQVQFATEEWFHVVGIFRGPTDMDIYVDGEEFTGLYSGSGGVLAYGTEAGRIGNVAPSRFYWGTLDDFAYYNKSLSYCEVQELYNDQAIIEPIIDSVTVCDSLIWIDGNVYFTDNSTATHTLSNVYGCDSIVKLNLEVNSINDQISQSGNDLSVPLTVGATYQWYKCDDSGQTIITGANSNIYSISSVGLYTVEINNLGCIKRLECFHSGKIGISEINSPILDIWYNSPINYLEVNLRDNHDHISIAIYTDLGQKNYSKDIYNEKDLMIPTSTLSSGIYFMTIQSVGWIKTHKFIVE